MLISTHTYAYSVRVIYQNGQISAFNSTSGVQFTK